MLLLGLGIVVAGFLVSAFLQESDKAGPPEHWLIGALSGAIGAVLISHWAWGPK